LTAGNGNACTRTQVLVMAKQPLPGLVKTRLAPRYGMAGAARLAQAALLDTLDAVAMGAWARQILVLDGDIRSWSPAGFDILAQRGGRLDQRIATACDEAFATVALPLLVIGADTPQLTSALLAAAAAQLAAPGIDAVIGPATDGGYWLLGLRTPSRDLIEGVPMSVPSTGITQLARLSAGGLRVALAPTLTDVDTPDDALAVAAQAPHSRFAAALHALDLDLRVEVDGPR
jgi:rSAM/selenodomain-associated transferase 1